MKFAKSALITRPANTTAYAAGDSIGGLVTISNMQMPKGGGISIRRLQILGKVAAVPASMAALTVHLFKENPAATAATVTDNVAFAINSADADKYIGSVTTSAIVDRGSVISIASENLNMPVFLEDEILYAFVVTEAGFTPAANSELYYLSIGADDE